MNCRSRSRINNNHEQRLRLGLRFRCTERMSPDTRSSLVADRPRASTVRMAGRFLLSPSILAAAAGIRCPIERRPLLWAPNGSRAPSVPPLEQMAVLAQEEGMHGWMLPRSCVACGCGHGPVPRPVQASSGTRGGVDHAGSPSPRPTIPARAAGGIRTRNNLVG